VAVTDTETAPVRRFLIKQLGQLGPLRDVQNQKQFIARLSGPAHPAPKVLLARLTRSETRLIKRACQDIARMDAGKLKRRMARLAEKLSGALKKSAAPNLLLRAHALLAERFAAVMWRLSYVKQEDPDSVHRVRVAFKKYRYLAEIWQPLFPQFTDEMLTRMQALQDRLGEIQDLRVLERMLADFKGKKVKGLIELRARVQFRLGRHMKLLLDHICELFEFQPPDVGSYP